VRLAGEKQKNQIIKFWGKYLKNVGKNFMKTS
jgi:hypothetical protein